MKINIIFIINIIIEIIILIIIIYLIINILNIIILIILFFKLEKIFNCLYYSNINLLIRFLLIYILLIKKHRI